MRNSIFNINLKKLHLSIVVFILGLLLIPPAQGQIIHIDNGSVTTCGGTFVDDDGGTVGGPYSPGESYVFTICPDNPGDVVSLQFHAFSLYQSPNPQNSDYLSIFDGNSTDANSLGSYTGTSLHGLPVTGTVNNASGCLTFVFNSNPNGNINGAFPGWEAEISCTTPCDNPTSNAVILDPAPLPGVGQSIGVCAGDPITFKDNGSFAAPGFNLQHWVWNFGDGTKDTLTSPGNITHSYAEPGEYLVTLTVFDNNGCRSINVSPMQVLVSTIPIFNTEFESPVCVGSEVTIDGSPIQSVTWTALPPQVVAGTMYLPDGAGFSFESSLIYDFFEEGATLDDCDDFYDLFMNMEHSYLGDLSMSITCPNGTEVILLPYPNQGGGTFLGEAVDDNNSTDPGIGWDYGFSPHATNGTINHPDNRSHNPFTDVNGNFWNVNIVNPGIYESHEDMCQLVGCPLNGEWTFTITDHLAIDNGYLFEWGINFNPYLYPDVTTFTPIIGMGPDSTWWEGPHIVSTSSDGNTITTTYPNTGFYDYTFFATNNFGCTYDTTLTIEVIEGPDITAGPDLFYCDEPVTLMAGLAGVNAECGNDSGNYTYCYGNNENMIVTYCPDNPGDGVTYMEMIINSGQLENNFDKMYIYDGDDTDAPLLGTLTGNAIAGSTFSATMANPTGCLTFQITSDGSISCQSSSNYSEMEITVSCGGGLGMVWEWSPTEGLSDPNVQNPTAEVTQATTYTVSAYPIGFPGCVITDQVVVAPDPLANAGVDTDTTFCYNSPIAYLTDYLKGNPILGGVWTDANGQEVPNQINPSLYDEGATFNYTYTVTNEVCEGTANLNLTILPTTNSSCCQTNAQAGEDAIPCALTYELQAEPTVGIGTWSTTHSDIIFSDIHDPKATVTCTTPGGGMRVLTWTDDNGYLCKVSDDITVHFADPLDLLIITEDANCYDECSGKAIGIADGGTVTGGNYIYDWFEVGKPGLIPATRDSLCAGTYMVNIFDDLGCKDSTTFVVSQPEPQEIFVTATPPLCADSCNGNINIISKGAIAYSFDGGESFIAENEMNLCDGLYTVVAKNKKGCTIAEEVRIKEPKRFVADFNINPYPTTIKNTTITFQDVSYPGPIKSSQYTFGRDPVLGKSEARMPTFTFPRDTAGIYPVTLISTNVNGCTDTLLKSVIINDDLLWFIPNSFSPNEDGINDVWKPIAGTIDVDNYKLSIYDRWGAKVFTTTDINEGWNGSMRGDGYYLEAGVYTYIIKVTSATTKERYELNGYITLLK